MGATDAGLYAARSFTTGVLAMAILRDRPYVQFNFVVDLGDGQTEGPQAGFAEVGGLGIEVETIEYRTGNMRENAVIKLPGLARYPDVTLKRGLIGSLALYEWMNQVRDGNPKAARTVTIQLLDEERSAVVTTWKLLRARVVKHTSGPFNARCSDVAVEELVLAYERLEME
jgi:phage tail-like protein